MVKVCNQFLKSVIWVDINDLRSVYIDSPTLKLCWTWLHTQRRNQDGRLPSLYRKVIFYHKNPLSELLTLKYIYFGTESDNILCNSGQLCDYAARHISTDRVLGEGGYFIKYSVAGFSIQKRTYLDLGFCENEGSKRFKITEKGVQS